MIKWLVTVVYVAGFLVSVVPISRALMREMGADGDQFESIMFCVIGVLVASFWPLIVAGWYVYSRVIRIRTVPPDKVDR